MAPMQKITWEQRAVDLSDIKPNDQNPRTITAAQYEKLKSSIIETGYHARLLCDRDLNLLGGHMRLKVMADLGITEAVILVPSRALTPTEAKRISIQDNVSFGDWDMDILSTDFSLEDLTGWGIDEKTLQFTLPVDPDNANDPDALPDAPPLRIALYGEIWSLGSHRLGCGSSVMAPDVEKLLAGNCPHLMVTDPPYGVSYDPTWRDNAGGKFGDGKTKMRGKVENDGRADWREAWALFPGDVAYVWHGALHAGLVAESLAACDFQVRSQIIWVKPHFIMSRGHYHWMHEPCWYAVRSKGKGHWNGDRKQTTVWEIAGMNPAGGTHKAEDVKSAHGTQKPVDCMRRPIENNSAPDDMIYDPFCGSGTTLIAAEMTGRVCFAMEINPAYVDMAIMRWQQFTGKEAVNAETGEKFNDRLSLSQARQAGAKGVGAGK